MSIQGIEGATAGEVSLAEVIAEAKKESDYIDIDDSLFRCLWYQQGNRHSDARPGCRFDCGDFRHVHFPGVPRGQI